MNSTMNSTQSISQTWPEVIQLLKTYYQLRIILGIFLAVLSVITTFGNGLLLLAIWRDPFKSFRTHTTYFFIIGLAVADFLTGLIVCPMHAWLYISSSLTYKNRDSSSISTLGKVAQVGQLLSVVTMNSSYIILLLFTWSQFTAINFPHKYRALVTKKRVQISVILTWAYSAMFSLFIMIQASKKIFFKIDLYFNTTGSLILLTVAYFCLFKAFRQQMRTLHSWRPNKSNGQQRRGRTSRERQLIIVNLLLLTFIIACTMQFTVISYLAEHWVVQTPSVRRVKLEIAMLFSNGILFLKFALDPLVYAWRLSQYRRALKSMLFCCRQRSEVDDFLSYTISNHTAISIRRQELNMEEINARNGYWPA